MSLRHSAKIIHAADIKAAALSLGFSACGIARADKVSGDEERHLRRWLAEGQHADMLWMENHIEKRLDPRMLVPGVKSIISVAMNYTPEALPPDDEPQLASYALGLDYHDVMRDRLYKLAGMIYGEDLTVKPSRSSGEDGVVVPYRVFVDSGPVLERYWAQLAGLGWVGRNQQLIIPKAGSMFFLGELFVDFETDYDEPMENRCGACHACIDHCPTGALNLNGSFNTQRCLSYQTIENRGPLSDEAKQAMGNTFYGCDRCQKACPWNRFAKPTDIEEFRPKAELLAMTKDRWKALTEDEYRRLFKGSAVKRAKYSGLMRNIENLK